MKNNLIIFNNEEFGQVRSVEINGEGWLVGKDVAEILEYKDTSDALKRHVDDEDKLSRCFTDSGQSREMYVINESGFYSLVLRSKMPKAKEFKRWITSDVLPTIRKTGGYVANENLFIDTYLPDADEETKSLFSMTLKTIREKNEKIREQQKQIVAQSNQIEDQKPLVEFANHVSKSERSGLKNMGEFAKLLHDENIDIGRNRLFDWFRKNGYLMENNTPYQKYINAGYFEVAEKVNQYGFNPMVYLTTLITGKGQVYFVNKFKEEYSESVS